MADKLTENRRHTMGKVDVEALKTRLSNYAEALFFGGEYSTKDVVNGISNAIKTIDTLAAEVEALKADAERYRKVRRDPAMLLHLRNTEFDSAIDALPPEPQGVGATQEGNADD